jgi:uncharacterized protein YndB with AHSA1/START domain
MTIAPIVRTVEVRARPERAFELFTRRFAEWWPKGRTPAASPHVEVVLEPHVGGRWFEIDAAGVQTHWGKVLAWDPPGRLVLAWQLNSRFEYDPALETEVEVTFAPQGEGTRVTLEHRHLERFGADAERMAGQLGGGWPGFLNDFAQYVSRNPS